MLIYLNTTPTDTDKELFARIAEGDESAFNQLYYLLLPVLTGITMKLLKSEEAVKEVLQESLIRLWMNRDKLPGIDHPRAWLFTIVSNECYRYLYKHGLQQRAAGAWQALQPHPELHGSPKTEMDFSFAETKRLIAQAVRGLSDRQRMIYLLSREEGLRIPEIAGKLGLSANYVKKTLMVALQRIREYLQNAGRLLPLLLIWLLS